MKINRENFDIREGHCGQLERQREILARLTHGKTRILEIGLNAGHSTELFLDESNAATVTSFDLFEKSYSPDILRQLSEVYGDRFQSIQGDTRETLPAWFAQNPSEPFDLVFVDGGHSFEVASSDLETVLQFVPRGCLIAMDDIVRDGEHKWFSKSPSQVWEDAVQHHRIAELGQINFAAGRGMAWGKKV